MMIPSVSLKNINLWMQFVALHCFDTRMNNFLLVMGFVFDPGALVEEQTLYLEPRKSGWCLWGSWFQDEQCNCQSEGQPFCFELKRMSRLFLPTLQNSCHPAFLLHSVSAGKLLYIFKAPWLFGLANHKHFQLFPSCTSSHHACQSYFNVLASWRLSSR